MAETALKSAESIVQTGNRPTLGKQTSEWLPWKAVEKKEEYRGLSTTNQARAKLQYFDTVVAPQLPENEYEDARGEFLNYTGRLEIEKSRPSFWREVVAQTLLKAPQRALGIGVGFFAGIPSFGLAPLVERELNKEKYDAMPAWEQVLVAFADAFKSFGKATFVEGEWGVRYGDYYKAVTGKTIYEDLPQGLKWSAPTLEFLAEVPFDPLIIQGSIANVIGKSVPKHWIGRLPAKVVRDLQRIETLEKAEQTVLRSRLLQILEHRKGYMEKWQDTVAFTEQQHKIKVAEEVAKRGKKGPPLLTPEGREPFDQLTASRQAQVGQPKREFAQMTEAEATALTKLIQERKMLGKIKPTSSEGIIAERRINEFRASKGWGPISKVPKEELAALEKADTVDKLNKFRAEKGLPPIKTKSATGLVAGVEEDEEGNISYNIEKGLAGTLLLAGGMTAFNIKRGQKFTQTLMDNPAWAKVHGTVGKSGKNFSMSGLLSKLNKGLFDRVASLEEFSPNTYAAARTFASYKDQAMVRFNQLREMFRPVQDDEVIMSDYINAHRMLSRAKSGVPNPDGVTAADATKAIKEMEAYYTATGKDVASLKKAFKDFQQWTHDNILLPARDSGVISEEGYKAIKKGNEFYATFEVLDHLPQDIRKLAGVQGEYYTVSGQKVIQKMTGTGKKIADPLESTIKKFTEAQAFFARNKVASIFVEDPVASKFIRPVASSKKEFAIMKNKGLDPVMEGSWNVNEFDTIGRMKNGTLEKYLAPKEIADSMKHITTHQAPRVIQAYHAIFRAAATTLSPAFLVRNVFRDAILGYIASPVHGALGPQKFLRDWGKGAWEAVKHELGKPSLVDDYIEAGGSFGWAGAEATEAAGKRAAKKLLFKPSPIRKVAGAITSPAQLIIKANEVVEMAPRLGLFDKAMELGYTLEDAAMVGRQATIDFNRGGLWSKVANQYIPFLNARIQAKVTLFEAFKKDPKGTSAKVMTTVMIPGIAGYAMNRLYFSDEYDDIPEHIRQSHFVMIYGTEINDDGESVPKYLAIPKGDAGTLINPIEFMLDRKIEEDPKGGKEFLINFLSDMSPIEFAREGELSGTKLASSLLPPIIKGVIEDWANLNFYRGSEIVPHYMGQSKPPELQYKESTPESFKWLGKKLGIAPLRLQNFAGNVLAGYGREGLSPTSMMRGLKGALLKTSGGEIENRAWTTIKDIEQGYTYIRAYAVEMVKDGDISSAIKIIKQWNLGINEQVDSFNERFGKYGVTDKGGIVKSYAFSRRKVAAMIRAARRDTIDKRSPLEKKLSRR